MDNLPNDLLIFKINSYLNLEEKKILARVNKRFSKIQSNTIQFHIGNVIGDHLGIDINTINSDMEIFRSNSLEFIYEIISLLYSETKRVKVSDYQPVHMKRMHYINENLFVNLGLILKINYSSKDECIKKFKEPNIFRINYIKNIENYKNSLLARKFFRTAYALI